MVVETQVDKVLHSVPVLPFISFVYQANKLLSHQKSSEAAFNVLLEVCCV